MAYFYQLLEIKKHFLNEFDRFDKAHPELKGNALYDKARAIETIVFYPIELKSEINMEELNFFLEQHETSKDLPNKLLKQLLDIISY